MAPTLSDSPVITLLTTAIVLYTNSEPNINSTAHQGPNSFFLLFINKNSHQYLTMLAGNTNINLHK